MWLLLEVEGLNASLLFKFHWVNHIASLQLITVNTIKDLRHSGLLNHPLHPLVPLHRFLLLCMSNSIKGSCLLACINLLAH